MNRILSALLSFPFRGRQKRLAGRSHLGAAAFLVAVSAAGGDADTARIVHGKLQDWIRFPGFTVYPDDDLAYIFGIAEEELDEDFILEILNQLGVRPPAAELVTAFGPVETPLDIARLVSLARRGNSDGSLSPRLTSG